MVYIKFSDCSRGFYTGVMLPQYIHIKDGNPKLDPLMISIAESIIVVDNVGPYWAKKNCVLTNCDHKQNLTPEENDEFLLQMIRSKSWPT